MYRRARDPVTVEERVQLSSGSPKDQIITWYNMIARTKRNAIDAVLLLPTEFNQVAIGLSNSLLSQDVDHSIILNTESCIPHISLCMGVASGNNLSEIFERLSRLAESYDATETTATSLQTKTVSEIGSLSEITIANTSELQNLHESIMKELEDILAQNATPQDFSGPVSDLTPQWVNGYASGSAFNTFNPHITLGFGRINPALFRGPLSFKPAALAVCHLGTYCTCREVLWRKRLK